MDRTPWTDQTPSASVEVVDQEAAATDIKTDEAAATDVPILMGMDLDVFNAAKEGKTEVLRGHDPQHLNQILTPTGNTVLHVYIAYAITPKLVKPKEEAPIKPTSVVVVEDILQVCPTLLWQQNESGETALHMAARHGCADIVELLIRTAKARRCEDLEQGTAAFALSSSSEEEAAYWNIYIRTLSKEKDTALHEAVRFKHLDVVEILIREDPDFSYPPNVAGETPLYLAAERRYKALFSEILRTCKHPTYQGPIGRTALHAAVIHGDEEMTKEILNKKKDLAIAADEKGWTPLHYAAFYDRASIVTQLLEADKCSAYMRDEADKKTALHIAGSKGHVRVMKQLISYCPDCCEVVDQRRRNALHYALEKRQSRIIDIIMMDTWLSNVLLNAKDVDGNTPLHLLNAPLCTETPFIVYDKVDKMAFNKENMNALDVIEAKDSSTFKGYLANELKRNGASSGHRILSENDNDGQKLKENEGGEDTETYKNIRESHLIVATLVATVAFAAGVTMPGGYYQASDQGNGTSNVSRQNVTAPSNGPTPGYAVLSKTQAFKSFYIFNMIALCLSW
ncbi:alpha-latroinsectotoxin-Lt1a-like [Prunus avium]|uniref:Alpha-latroinsectotoxin-Lt1a-like n=1 Tax=Prunus avium TaxID=42229 RepID=A0A6P5RI64_PRUAV|nr:alpha-latroinsectotoxin-Lt1a-like [Prunus avium]